MENTKLLPLGTEQGLEETEYPSFDLCLGENMVSPLVAQHRQWLKTIRHEVPNPKIPFKVAVYIRFFNQTKYRDEEYLERNKEVFRATLAQYPMWEFVGFYIDNGSTAPYMENSTAWSELLSDCDAGKVDLIITQKVSNVSRDAQEMAICARMLAARKPPVGIYFISEDLSRGRCNAFAAGRHTHGAWTRSAAAVRRALQALAPSPLPQGSFRRDHRRGAETWRPGS